MLACLPILVVVPHAEAGDRTKWTADQDLRPLTDVGRRQATTLAAAVGRVDAILSSPARRCVEPIAAASGAEIEVNDDLRELTFVSEHESWDAWQFDPQWRAQLLTAAGLGRVLRTLARIEDTVGAGGRVAISAHGDLVPLFALLAAGYFRVPAPGPPRAAGATRSTRRTHPGRSERSVPWFHDPTRPELSASGRAPGSSCY